MKSSKLAARAFGIFFILTFLSYGVGSGIIDSIVSSNGINPTNAQFNTLVTGVILTAIVHTICNIGLLVTIFPILKPFNNSIAYGYLSAGVAATVLLAVGSIFILLYIPLHTLYPVLESQETLELSNLKFLIKMANQYSYQIGMAIWGIGGLLFCHLLIISKLVPKFFPIAGIIGYAIFISGTLLELFGIPYGVILSLPGGLFEIILSIWLIIKGFSEKNKAIN